MTERLPTHLEVGGIIRRAVGDGDFATILKRGDEERGSLLLVVTSRGRHFGCLERLLDLDGNYAWGAAGPPQNADSAEVSSFLAKRTRFDEDLWVLELDVADAERFTAETVAQA